MPGLFKLYIFYTFGLIGLLRGSYFLILGEDASLQGNLGRDFSALYGFLPLEFTGLLDVLVGLFLLSLAFFLNFRRGS